ncbi:MAG: glycosyltransferase family 39 protein [Planctomycetota bacterium]|nr:glycosyltransferase family 39 protein [Planctomycetota bacterium]
MKRWALALPLLVLSALFVLRLAGPADILDKDQPRPIEYIVDALANGQWIMQRDAGGSIASKPPLYTWLAALSTAIFGGSRFALYLPCAAAFACLTALATCWTARRLGWAAGLAAGMCLALAFDTQKAIVLARTDAVFAACVALTAYAALRAWEGAGSWVRFWLAAALTTLAKTPVGVLFASGGLLAAWWRGERPRAGAPALGSQVLGLLLFLALTVGWLLLAVHALGQPVLDKLIGQELIRHATENDKGTPLWLTWWRPPLWYVGLFLPWSLAAGYALWRLWRRPPLVPRQRRFLRFMACWLGVGLLILMLAPHKRLILGLPMLFPGAVLAGVGLSWLLRGWHPLRWAGAWLLASVLVLSGLWVYHQHRDRVKDQIAASEAVIATGGALSALAARGIAVSWNGLPPCVRYFIAGMPPATSDPAAWLAQPGPQAVAVLEDREVVGAALYLRPAPGFRIALDAEAAARR